MPGSYCRFCGHRCFVLRELPEDAGATAHPRTLHMATCAKGKEHDRKVTGYDADTAVNPLVPTPMCECIVSCAEHPPTACSLSGEPHVHPGITCPVHPDAPGDQ